MAEINQVRRGMKRKRVGEYCPDLSSVITKYKNT
jgi:hypothetical protein